MDKIKQAKSILQNYEKNRFEYKSNLMDTDHKLVKDQKTIMKFFKHTKTDRVISEALADQIINYHKLGKISQRLETYLYRRSKARAGSMFLAADMDKDIVAENYGEYLKNIADNLISVLREKKDNALFNEKLAEFNEIYSSIAKEDPEEAYGVVVSYRIKSISPLSAENKKRMKSIDNVANELLQNTAKQNSENQREKGR